MNNYGYNSPPPNNYGGSNNYGPQMPPPGKGKATASMVLGIIALVFCWLGFLLWFSIIPIALSIIGLVLAISAKKEMSASGNLHAGGSATAGLVMSVIALALSAIFLVTCIIVVSCAASTATSYYGGYYYW